KTLGEPGCFQEMEELVTDELEGPALTVATRIYTLEERLEEQTPDKLYLLLGNARALAEEDEEEMPAIKDLSKVEHVVGPEHEPEVLGKKQRLDAREDRILGGVGNRRKGA